MFNLAENTKLRGIGYKVLNVLRPCNIVALLAVMAASWVMIVETGLKGEFFFFDAIAHVFASSVAMFLILSEAQFGLLKKYFARTWPVFSDRHGFLWLGAAMVVLGCDTLANLNKPAFSVATLGLPLWRLILAAGILSLTFGLLNLAATLVFRDGPARLTARMIRADGNLADGRSYYVDEDDSLTRIKMYDNNYYGSSRNASMRKTSGGSNVSGLSGVTVGGDSEQQQHNMLAPSGVAGAVAGRFRRMTQVFKKSPFAVVNGSNSSGSAAARLNISHPMPIASSGGGDTYSHVNDDGDDDIERAAGAAPAFGIAASQAPVEYGDASTYRSNSLRHYRHSFEDRASPILPDVRRPPTALHPALSSHYSVANMTQF